MPLHDVIQNVVDESETRSSKLDYMLCTHSKCLNYKTSDKIPYFSIPNSQFQLALFILADAEVKCDAGDEGNGGTCICSKAVGWTLGRWETPVCHKGACYTGQSYDECKGKDNGHLVGDGTFCYSQKRYTQCPTSGMSILRFSI